MVGERTAVSRTWELASGARVTQVAAGPVQWKDGHGAWREFDLAIRSDTSGWSGSAGPTSVQLPAHFGSEADEPLRVSSRSGETLTMVLLGARTAKGTTDGTSVTYAGVRRDVDVRLRLIPEGLKEDVVLHSPGASRRLVYRLTLDAPGGRVATDRAGGVRIERGERLLFRIPPPLMADANGMRFQGDRFIVEQIDARTWTLTLEPDAAWLDAPARRWPVVVDPTIVADEFDSPATDNCDVLWIHSTSSSYAGFCHTYPFFETMRVGIDFSPSWRVVAFGLLRFDTLTFLPTDSVLSARLRLYRQSDFMVRQHTPIRVYGVNESWSAATMTPTMARTIMESSTFRDRSPLASFEDGPVGPMSTDVTELVQQWQRHAQTRGAQGRPNFGVQLVHADTWEPEYQPDAGCFYYYYTCDMTFIASSINPVPENRPVLEVTSMPAAPAAARS